MSTPVAVVPHDTILLLPQAPRGDRTPNRALTKGLLCLVELEVPSRPTLTQKVPPIYYRPRPARKVAVA